MDNKSPTPQFYSENRKALHDWMTDKSCAYCDGVSWVGYFADPKVVKCLACGLFRFFPRISPEGVKISMENCNQNISFEPPTVSAKIASSRNRAVLKMLKRQIPNFSTGLKALDVGCSTRRVC